MPEVSVSAEQEGYEIPNLDDAPTPIDPKRPTLYASDKATRDLNQAITEQTSNQQILNSAVKKHQIWDPIMTGYFGGANQYPSILEGVALVSGPEAGAFKFINIARKGLNVSKMTRIRLGTAFGAMERTYNIRGVQKRIKDRSFDDKQKKIQRASEPTSNE